MALIKDGYDLSGGAVLSDEVATPNNWRVTATTTGCPATQVVKFIFEVEDEAGNWASMLDGAGRVISFSVRGNQTRSLNPVVVNAANGRVRIVPKGILEDVAGSLDLDSINS